MPSTTLIRWSGLACFLSGLLLPVPGLMEVMFGLAPDHLTMSLKFAAITILIFALMSIYGYQVEERGGFGFLGFTFAILMNCIGLPGISWVPGSTEVPEAVEMLTLLIGAAGLFGYSLQSIGSWKANKLPRWSVVLWPIRYVISAVGGMAENAQALHVIGISIWGIGMIGVAIRIWSAMGEPAKKLEAAI